MISTYTYNYSNVLLIFPKPIALLDDSAGNNVMAWRSRFRPEEKELPIKMGGQNDAHHMHIGSIGK